MPRHAYHAHRKLHDQFVALVDMKLHAKINFTLALVFEMLKF